MRFSTYYQKSISLGLLSVFVWASSQGFCLPAQAQKLAMGVGTVQPPMPGPGVRASVHVGRGHSKKWIRGAFSKLPPRGKHKPKVAKIAVKKVVVKAAHKGVMGHIPAGPMQPPAVKNLAPGVTYKLYAGHPRINVVDIDMSKSPVKMRPVTASYAFNQLKDVREHARDSGAIAAINANYFKTGGVPLGTLMVDGEWVSGPLYDRVALGFTDGGYARIARVGLHGTLYTSNPDHPEMWINNVNQPHRTGSRCILYTRRWGEKVTFPFAGTMVAVDASGKVLDKAEKVMAIPYGGFVLADSKKSPIAALKPGDLVHVRWQTNPSGWDNVKQAVSGGPLLLQDGKFAFDLKSEKFPANWTGGHIVARTACGITADDHLLLATFEGPHTLFDVAKFFLKMGCTEAMNLDGGGSTTMVVNGATVTRNASASQRHVAVALGVFTEDKARNLAACNGCGYRPKSDLASFTSRVELARIGAQAGLAAGGNAVGNTTDSAALDPASTHGVTVSATAESSAAAAEIATDANPANVSDSTGAIVRPYGDASELAGKPEARP
ncbi:MAG: phosphodiester glycosidase family protein [Cyanobacteria bacterium SZAS LIN-3]|nr:phosphodiester glycosidase family protein [Cyanobacteria bacterium SZAS LIN-3]